MGFNISVMKEKLYANQLREHLSIDLIIHDMRKSYEELMEADDLSQIHGEGLSDTS